MQAYCIDRLIDPTTTKAVAGYGWVQERNELPGKYWVSIEAHPIEFFGRKEDAKFFYDHLIARLVVAIHVHGTTNVHNRRPPI